jgi:hypothetical protein
MQKETNRTVLKENLYNLQIFLTISSDSVQNPEQNPDPVQLNSGSEVAKKVSYPNPQHWMNKVFRFENEK